MKNTDIFKKKLEKELKLVEAELAKVARRNPEHPEDWEATEPEDADRIDEDSVADDLEDFTANTAIVRDLKAQYENIRLALEKIKKGTYGRCEVCGEEIPEKRLEANPSARTCVKHAK
jgi:RNA polymerase-binding transcription factor DksA